jgi:hypothetical protein
MSKKSEARPKTKVRILTGIAGNAMPHYDIGGDFMFRPGEVTLLDSELAAAWIAGGIAEAVL